MNPYIGHPTQLCGVEEHRLVGGRGDGMRLYEVRNGKGMELTLSPDRNGDITRLRFKGENLSYFSPCGYVAPTYYDNKGSGWLHSFTAGFLTTCGLQAVGNPCTDQGMELPLHGSIANLPCEQCSWEEDDASIRIRTVTRDAVMFGPKLVLRRVVEISKEENTFVIRDEIANEGDQVEPVEILYHMNMGYPLLDEESVVHIPSAQVIPRDAHAAEDIAHWSSMEKPQAGYRERCYYHVFADERGSASIYQPKLNTELEITFDASSLDGFVEWKMMGVGDYVLGLECGNCYPDGRDVMREKGMLKFLQPGERQQYSVYVRLKERME